MSQLHERIAQFQKMAHDDPDNELGHFRLGQLFMEAKQLDDAVASFRRTLEISPQFSKVYQLLGTCLNQLGRRDEAVATLKEGFAVADERGDNLPRDEMARLLVQLGEPAPVSQRGGGIGDGPGDGFRCERPGCMMGARARRLTKPPFKDELGGQIVERICADCWNDWLKNFSVKVINELRLDLSTEGGQKEYDRYMREYLGLE
jgi:tetratricopeptide (TPR) repeat protein